VLIHDYAGAEPRVGEFRWAAITGSADYDLLARLEAEVYAEPADLQPAAEEREGMAGLRLVNIEPAELARGAGVRP
jgi:hypothetical protein